MDNVKNRYMVHLSIFIGLDEIYGNDKKISHN